MQSETPNPYASPNARDPNRHGVAVIAFTSLLVMATLFVFWWSTPPVARAVQIFAQSDLQLKILRFTTSTLFTVGTLLCLFATISCWQSKWRRMVHSLFAGATFVAIGSLIVRVYYL